jgi:hypothetical protein
MALRNRFLRERETWNLATKELIEFVTGIGRSGKKG